MAYCCMSGSGGLTPVEKRAVVDEIYKRRCRLCRQGFDLTHEDRVVCSVGKRFPDCVGEAGGFEVREAANEK